MQAGNIDEKFIGTIAKQVSQALAYLHKHNIIHRDIKGKNTFQVLAIHVY